jgi:hypothetical protein
MDVGRKEKGWKDGSTIVWSRISLLVYSRICLRRVRPVCISAPGIVSERPCCCDRGCSSSHTAHNTPSTPLLGYESHALSCKIANQIEQGFSTNSALSCAVYSSLSFLLPSAIKRDLSLRRWTFVLSGRLRRDH